MVKTLRNRFSVWGDWYYTYQKQIILSKDIPVKNKKLYEELEKACQKQDGILTYAEYLTIDQFGKYGFYATSGKHGKTDIHFRWGKALANYCHKNGYDRIIEFGCGTGELGVVVSKEYTKLTNHSLKWIGVEIDKNIHEKILKNFIENKLENSIESLVASVDEIPPHRNALVVFPYCLDNIPPQMFLNTESYSSYPNALLGITFANGMLSEILMPQEIGEKKGIKLKNGIFTQNNLAYNLSAWKMRRGQRLCLPIDAFAALYHCAKKFNNSELIIIDELRNEQWNFTLNNLGTPKSLYEKNNICYDRKRYYQESGKHNLYYPLYKISLLKFLNKIGYKSIEYDIEQKKAAELGGSPWYSLRKNYATYAFIAKNFSPKEARLLLIPSAQRKII